MTRTATCPYCKREGIDRRGLIPHIRMSKDDAHGPQGELPDDTEDRVNTENTELEFVRFDTVEADIDEPDEPGGPDAPERCPECDADAVYVLSEGEPIELNGVVIAHGHEDDVICLACGELIDVKMPDELE